VKKNIVSIYPVEEIFSITWMLSKRCNYDCMYCSTDWHDSSSKFDSLDDMKSYWLTIYEKTKNKNLKYKISFTGGELTGNKYFLPFVQWLRENYRLNINSIILSTNGSATLSYYKKLFKVIDNISFSFHSEHANEQKFFDMVVNLKLSLDSNNFLHVNIMNEYWNENRIPLYKNILDKYDISYSINTINYDLGHRKIPIIKGKLNLNV
jgi:MoaA/NifB/PqqE/SkfB family radical SAM enzyme